VVVTSQQQVPHRRFAAVRNDIGFGNGYLLLRLMAVASAGGLPYDEFGRDFGEWNSCERGPPSLGGDTVGQFGDKFRKAREKKGISLDDASNVTKIGARMLQAIEEENFEALPGGVFNKGFIRAYAKHLGINDQEAVSEYLECLRNEQVRAQAVWEPQTRPAAEKRAAGAAKSSPSKPQKPAAVAAQTATRAQAEKSAEKEELADLQLPKAEHVRPPHQKYLERDQPGIPWRLVVATVVVLLLVVILWRRHVIRGSAASAASSTAINSSASSAPPGGGAGNAAVTSGNPTETIPSHDNKPGTPATAAAKPAADPDNGDDQVITRSFVPPAAPADKPAAQLTLVIRATENSYISVSADGKTVTQETLIAPANTSVRAGREIVAHVGNAAGVTFLWNGQEISANGAEGEPKTFVFDAQGMHVAGTGLAPQN
jgi:cytoskeleton protein RodZ